MPLTTPIARLRAHALRPVDGASLAALRVAFGALMAAGLARYLLTGWVEEVFVEPSFFFKYPGFEWVAVPGPAGLYGLMGATLAGALGMALGPFFRASAAAFTVGFAWLNLMDQTTYLNHYYFVVILGALLGLSPAGRVWSLDARRRPARRLTHIPAWVLWVFRFQIAVVYVHAGLAKVQADWLLHAQPLSIWLSARTDLPGVGPWLGAPWVAYFMAWAGCLYDLTIVGWLSWQRTRAWAYGAVLGFHAATHVLFDIGMFPFLMSAAAPIFFAPAWPRRLLRRAPMAAPAAPCRPPHRALAWAAVLWLGFQALWPLRSHLLEGDVLWNDRGMRFAWKVMVREKQGSVTYRVRVAERERPFTLSPARYLTWRQHSEMASRPRMIAQLAHHVAHDLRARGLTPVAIHADAWASLNGRPAARLIDPQADLIHLDPSRPGWILPASTQPPLAAIAAARSDR